MQALYTHIQLVHNSENVQNPMVCVPCAVDELRSAALMYEAELQTKLAVADGLRSILGGARKSTFFRCTLQSCVRPSDQVFSWHTCSWLAHSV